MLALVENARRKQLAWVEAILAHKNWRPSRLAREAGIDHSTLSKFLNDPLNASQLGSTTVEKLATATGWVPYHAIAPTPPRGLAEKEAEPYSAQSFDLDADLARAVALLRSARNAVDPWILRSRALENAGYLPGDVVLVDQNEEARNGDAVCAQVYDKTGRVETVMRIYEHPFLVSATLDPALRRPLLVDGDSVQLRGVVISSLRPRRAA